MNQVDDPIGQAGWKKRAVVRTAVFAQPSRHIDAWEALAQGKLHVGIGLVIAQQDVEFRLALLDQIVFEREGFLVVGDHDVIDIDGLAHKRTGFGVGPAGLVEVGSHPAP